MTRIEDLTRNEKAQPTTNLILDKEKHSIFIPEETGPSKFIKRPGQLLPKKNASLIIRTRSSGGRPLEDRSVVVLKGKKYLKKLILGANCTKERKDSPVSYLGKKMMARLKGKQWLKL